MKYEGKVLIVGGNGYDVRVDEQVVETPQCCNNCEGLLFNCPALS